MWAFPEVELDEGGAPGAAAIALLRGAPELGVESEGTGVALDPVEHRFTHLHAIYRPWAVPVRRAVPADALRSQHIGDHEWATPARADELALPVAQRRVLEAWHRVWAVAAERASQ
jgi:hypothetical protein